ncbi:LbetaH domain-containing protein [Helicobacter marmotae]|nr:hypothetical protein [Helicobacter marmotae]
MHTSTPHNTFAPLIPSLHKHLHKQISQFFEPPLLDEKITDIALAKFHFCTHAIEEKYFQHGSLSMQDFYHSDKYAMFLCFLQSAYALAKQDKVATQIYYLNKILHSIDVFYEISLPDIFIFTHPLGSVLGRAKYSNFLSIYQNCTIGGDERGGHIYYPSLGVGVALYAGAKIIGKCDIGDNVIFGANSFIINCDVPSNSIVVGSYPNHRILANPKCVLKDIFHTKLTYSQAKTLNLTQKEQK